MSFFVRMMKMIFLSVGSVSIGVLIYQLFQHNIPNAEPSHRRRKSNKLQIFSHHFRAIPITIDLVKRSHNSTSGAYISANAKNKNYIIGAQLIAINGETVDDCRLEVIARKLKECPLPITLQFKECPDLEAQWKESEQLKLESNVAYKNGDFETALRLISNAINLHSTNKLYFSNRVLMYLKKKEFEKAGEDCAIIEELDPQYVKGIYLKGLVYFNQKKYSDAMEIFERVHKLNPDMKPAIARRLDCQRLLLRQYESEGK